MAKKTRASRSRSPRKATTVPSAPDGGNALERGEIFFFYRPGTQTPTPGSLLEVNRFHVVLRPSDGERLRYLTIGKKKLPAGEQDDRN